MAMTVLAPEADEDDACEGSGSIMTRARRVKPNIQARVAFCRGLMLANDWHKRLLPDLAAVWGVGESTARNYSAEASRTIRAALNPSVMRAKVMDRLDASYKMALRETFSPAKASEAMTKSALALAQIAGIDGKDAGPQVTINVGTPARSAVLDAIWGPVPTVVEVRAEALPEAAPEAAPEAETVTDITAETIDDWR